MSASSEGAGAGDGGEAPTAAMLVIGDEILSGRTQDKNAHHLAGIMSEIGVRLLEIRVVSDEEERIVEAVNALRGAYTYVFTSGGIGPTHDDITADSVAKAFGVGIGVREDARAILEAHYEVGQLNEARLRMARIPDGAELIDNPVSKAPGFRLGNVHVMAGVPVIFREMLAGLREKLVGGPPLLTHSLKAPVKEGDIAGRLGALAERHAGVSIGVYPFFRGGLGATLVARSPDPAALAAAAAEIRALLIEAGANPQDIEETPSEAA